MQTKENAQAKELKIKDSAKVPSTIDRWQVKVRSLSQQMIKNFRC
jgi:hypothetical protein